MCIAYGALEICDANILSNLEGSGYTHFVSLLICVYIEFGFCRKIKAGSTRHWRSRSNYPVQPLFPCEVTTGLPQRLPISPVHFTVYFAEIHEVEKQVEWCRGIPLVDDVTWLAEGASLNDESLYCLCIYFLYSFLYSTPSGKGAGGALLFIGGGSCWGFLGGRSLRFIGHGQSSAMMTGDRETLQENVGMG